MNIEWNQVTWYSKLIATVVFLVTAGIFFELGTIYGSATTMINDFSRENLIKISSPKISEKTSLSSTYSLISPSSTSFVSSTPPVYIPTTTPPGPEEVTWAEAQSLTRQCKVVQLEPGFGGGSYIFFDVKASLSQGKDFMKIIFDYRPTVAELTALAESVSSTCGLVRVQNPMR